MLGVYFSTAGVANSILFAPPLRQGLMIMTDDSFKEGCSRLGPLQVQAGVVVMRASQASFGIS